MNDPMKNFSVGANHKDDRIAETLAKTAEQIEMNPGFQAELERGLKEAYKSKGASAMSLRKFVPAFGWAIALIVLVIALNWAIRSLAPEGRSAAEITSTPAFELSPVPTTVEEYEVKAGDTCASIAVEHGVSLQSVILSNNLPADCSTLYIGQSLKIPNPTPIPGALSTNNSHPPLVTTTGQSYDWRGTKLSLGQPLPESPTEANVYLLKPDQRATVDEARALARRFGIEGGVYQIPGQVHGTTDYVISDGKQSLMVSSNLLFNYTADLAKYYNNFTTGTGPNGGATIDDFLRAHGFDFPHITKPAELFSGYVVEPLSPDGYPIRYEFFSSRPMLVSLDEGGRLLSLQANLPAYENVPVGRFSIRTAEEAFQKILNESGAPGTIESVASPSRPLREWRRAHPLNQVVTIYDYVSWMPALDAGQPPFIQIDGHAATGKISGIVDLPQSTFVEATGRFVVENGIEKFNIESWRASELTEDGLLGTLQRDGQNVVIATDTGAYILPDAPNDLPLPFESAYAVGVKLGDVFEWKLIDDRMSQNGGGGGGGGGGWGFHKLNLTGTPVPMPTSMPAMPEQVQSAVRIEGRRGMVAITHYMRPDGDQRTQYAITINEKDIPFQYAILQGAGLESLEGLQNRPITVWGVMDHYDINFGAAVPVLRVERFEIPFPDLKFQILEGKEKIAVIENQSVLLFETADGKTYVMDGPGGEMLDAGSRIGLEGDLVLVETLNIPDETFGGYPILRMFNAAMAINPKTGARTQLEPVAAQVYVMDEPRPAIEPTPSLPTLTIEGVELIYFVTNQNFQVDHLEPGPQYLQPVWRFYGHYDNGDEYEILVQALKDEFLLPELAPFVRPG